MKKFLKVLRGIGIAVGGVLIIVLGYVLYMVLTYHRIADNTELEITAAYNEESLGVLPAEGEYSIMTYNVGFGAYTPEYSFFMDGGKYSWALSEEAAREALAGATSLIRESDPDFVMVQEIDLDATRSYHINEYELINEELYEYASAYAIDYDSSFMMYPFYHPHGKVKAGLCLYSKYEITSSLRRSLPISTSFSKFVDLDRCYSITRIPVDNGRELVIMTLHLSAYGNSDAIREGQVNMLIEDMEKEYAAGNYVIVGGDFNHDLKADEDATDDLASWAYPFPRSSLPSHFEFAMDQLGEEVKEALWNSSRNADMAYDPEETYTVTLDGFIISDNITMTYYENINTGYSYSDHDPVLMRFTLD